MGKKHISKEQVLIAARIANVMEFANELTDGLNSTLGPRGSALSSGQMQRIAVARAIVGNPKVLLLDEHTSALDATSERLLLSSLEKVMTKTISVMIAHRLSTASKCAKILVLAKGRIVEQGTHAELLAVENGHYSKLWRARES